MAKETRSAYEHFFITSIFMFCTKVNISNLMKGEYSYTKLILLFKRGNLCKFFINIIYFNHIFYFRNILLFFRQKMLWRQNIKIKEKYITSLPNYIKPSNMNTKHIWKTRKDDI